MIGDSHVHSRMLLEIQGVPNSFQNGLVEPPPSFGIKTTTWMWFLLAIHGAAKRVDETCFFFSFIATALSCL